MGGYLGFDRARVRALRGALAELEVERRRLGRDVGEAGSALVAYRTAVGRLVEWQGRLDDILGSAGVDACPRDSYVAVQPSWTLPDVVALTGGGRRDEVVTDPLRFRPKVDAISAIVRAESVARLLREIDLDALATDDELLDAVAGELFHIARSPAAAARCWQLLGERAVPVAQSVAGQYTEQLERTAPGSKEAEPPRAVLLGFGALLATAWPRPDNRAGRILAQLPPAGGAALLAGSAQGAGRLPASALTRAAVDVLVAARRAAPAAHTQLTVDDVLTGLARDGRAARAVLEDVDDETFDFLVLRPFHDPARLGDVLLASSDPARTTAAQVEVSMRRVLERYHLHRELYEEGRPAVVYMSELPTGLGRYVGRWAEAMVHDDRGRPRDYPVETWAVGDQWATDVVGWLATNPTVAAELVATLPVRYAGRAGESVAADRVSDLQDLTYAHAALFDIVVHARAERGFIDEAEWASLVSRADTALGLSMAAVPGAEIVAPMLGGVHGAGGSATGWLVGLLVDEPDGPRRVLARLASEVDAADVVLEHIAVQALVTRFARLHSGQLPAPPPAPARAQAAPGWGERANVIGTGYHDELARWTERLADSRDPAVRQLGREIIAATSAVRGAALDARNHAAG
jgi:hypothetical protein